MSAAAPANGTQQNEQQRLGQIDQARPVDQAAIGRVEPMLDEIEPALPVEEIVHLGQPHGVVGVEDQRRGGGGEPRP